MIIDFANHNFHRSCSAEDHRFSLHTIGEVWMHSPAEFPLRPKYDKANLTLAGIEHALSPQDDPRGIPLPNQQLVDLVDEDEDLVIPDEEHSDSRGESPAVRIHLRDDCWSETDEAWVRHHYAKRRPLFSPRCR